MNASSPGGNHAAIRVLVVDDSRVVRLGLLALLADQPDIVIVGEADNGELALERARELAPDVVLMDINLPGMDGVQTTRRLKAEFPGLGIVGLSLHEDADTADELLEAGASRYVIKGAPTEDLCRAIRESRQIPLA